MNVNDYTKPSTRIDINIKSKYFRQLLKFDLILKWVVKATNKQANKNKGSISLIKIFLKVFIFLRSSLIFRPIFICNTTLKSYWQVNYSCFVNFEISQQIRAVEQKEKFDFFLLWSLNFLRYLKMNKTGLIHISVAFHSRITHKNWLRIERATQKTRFLVPIFYLIYKWLRHYKIVVIVSIIVNVFQFSGKRMDESRRFLT